MMNRPRLFHCGVGPGLEDLKDKKTIPLHQTGVGHPALEVGITFVNERGGDLGGRLGREAKGLELIYVRARGIAATHHLFGDVDGGDVNDAFVACRQQCEGMVAIADDATHQGRLKLEHGMPGHGHDVWVPRAGGGDQDDRPRFEQAVNLGERKGFFGHLGITCSRPWQTPPVGCGCMG